MNEIEKLQQITPAKALEQFQMLTVIDLTTRVGQMAGLSLDMRFKKPIINQRLKRMNEDANTIIKDLQKDRKYGFSVADMEYVEDATAEMFELITLAVQFGKEGIAALNSNLKEQIQNAKEQRSDQTGAACA